MHNNIYNEHSSQILEIAKEAGAIIMRFYNDDVEIRKKEDASPVTEADVKANNFIVENLKRITPNIPVVAEESHPEENAKAIASKMFWLVDPLDGTKSFIKRTGEFTVNIALIDNFHPVGGAIYLPAQDISYFTKDNQSYKQTNNGAATSIKSRNIPDDKIIVVASKSHCDDATKKYINSLKNVDHLISASSSMKFCLIAEGLADIYPRFGRTMEWDTAAGHAILHYAGGEVEDMFGKPFLYRKKDFENGYFIARGKY